jgi:hypothetical protein
MARHQSHSVAQRNKRERLARRAGLTAQPPITLSPTVDDQYDGTGHLKVVPVREFSFNVPYELTEGKFSYEDAPNPINQLGPVIESCVPVATSNDFASFMAAFNKRSNTAASYEQFGADDIQRDVFDEAMAMIRQIPDKFAGRPWDENDLDRQRWLNKFDDAKRLRMEEAWTETISWADPKYLGTKDLSVKQEILLKRNDPSWAPRVIYAGNDAYNAVTGPAAMVMMERLVELVDGTPVGDVFVKYAYKANDTSLCDFIITPELKEVVEGDYSANDKHQKYSVLALYLELVKKVNVAPWYAQLLRNLQRFKVQNRRFGLKAWLGNQLPTGCTETTVRNSWYNTLMFAVACRRQRRKARALILGDDLLACMDRRFDLARWVGDVARFKMVLKAKSPQMDGEATFLSRRIFAEVETPCMVPLLGKMLARFNCRGTMNDACTDSQYMAGKALSYAYECRHVPFIRKFFLERYRMEDFHLVTTDDLTWFTRTSGEDLSNIVAAIEAERVLVSDDELEVWLVMHYDSTLRELEEIFEAVVLSAEQTVLDLPSFSYYSKDC